MGRKNLAVVIKKSRTNGRGLFARKNFRSGEQVLDWNFSARFVLFLNRSCAPNCTLDEVSKDPLMYYNDKLLAGPSGVKRGEEITCDYSTTKWRRLWKQTIKNRCSCSKCRSKAA